MDILHVIFCKPKVLKNKENNLTTAKKSKLSQRKSHLIAEGTRSSNNRCLTNYPFPLQTLTKPDSNTYIYNNKKNSLTLKMARCLAIKDGNTVCIISYKYYTVLQIEG